MNKKILVYGLGYVGLSNAILLAQNNQVIGVDVVESKVEKLNNKISPIIDKDISDYLANKPLNFVATTNADEEIKSADFLIVSTPTNFDEEKNFFDTNSVESVVGRALYINPNITIVVKSTIPIGFMDRLCQTYKNANFLFSPEFLREGRALFDNLNPSRIIVACDKGNAFLLSKAQEFASLLLEGADKKDVPMLIMGYKEAESVKLFANTYLAMRVAYINELDNFSQENNLCTKDIIEGMCADPRIGNFYNNPSFGFGGYCFPKDTKQLLANFENVPNKLIRATVESNKTRKEYLANHLVGITKPKDTIGIYRMVMKANSDNCRSSAIFDIIKILCTKRKVVIYEPTMENAPFEGCILTKDLKNFKNECNIIVANRLDDNLSDVASKVYTRDIFNRD